MCRIWPTACYPHEIHSVNRWIQNSADGRSDSVVSCCVRLTLWTTNLLLDQFTRAVWHLLIMQLYCNLLMGSSSVRFFQCLQERGVLDGVQLQTAAQAGGRVHRQVVWVRGQVERPRQGYTHHRHDIWQADEVQHEWWQGLEAHVVNCTCPHVLPPPVLYVRTCIVGRKKQCEKKKKERNFGCQ